MGLRDECSRVIQQITIDEFGDWKQEFLSLWEDLDCDQRSNIFEELLGLVPSDQKESLIDQLFPDSLSSLVPNIPVRKFAPSAWNEARELISNYLNQDEASYVLCLVDYDLRGDTRHSSSDGAELLKRALNEVQSERVLWGILSQTFPINEELTRGKEFGRSKSIPLSKFLPLSKQRLSDKTQFVAGLRLALLMLSCATLTREVAAASEKATKTAQSVLEDISVHEFYHVVLKNSEDEGIWEVETLLRLFNIYRSNYERTYIYHNRRQLNEWTRRIRNLILPDGPEIPQTGDASKHNKAECYDSDTTLNAFHLPLELGDILQRGGQYYIVLGQPCDLAMRKEGRRSSKYVTLVPVRYDEPKDNQRQTTAPLEFFGPTGERAFAYFKHAQIISLDILDLIVFNAEGKCVFTVGQECPQELHGPWQKRFEQLKHIYEKKARELEDLRSAISGLDKRTRDLIWSQALNTISMPTIPNILSYQDGQFDFGFKRIARYRAPRVTTLLQQWAAFLSRPAFERPFVLPESDSN